MKLRVFKTGSVSSRSILWKSDTYYIFDTEYEELFEIKRVKRGTNVHCFDEDESIDTFGKVTINYMAEMMGIPPNDLIGRYGLISCLELYETSCLSILVECQISIRQIYQMIKEATYGDVKRWQDDVENGSA